MSPPDLTVRDVLTGFDRWNDGNPGPAYGRVVLYAADEIGFEGLVRAVLEDQDHGPDPDRWQEYASVVSEAFEVWMKLTRPYVAGDELDELGDVA